LTGSSKATLALVLGLLLVSSVAVIGLNLVPAAHANITTTISADTSSGCSTIGGSWDGGTFTCTLSSTYEVDPGTLVLLTFGTLHITSSGIIGNSGVFYNNGGNVENEGIFEDQANAVLNNTGAFNNAPLGTGSLYIDSGAVFNNPGAFTNGATMNNAGTTNVLSGGSFYNNGPGTLVNTGTLSNFGAFHNAGTFQDSTGVFLEQCGGTISDNFATNPFFANEECQPASSGAISTLTSDISSLSASLSSDYASISTAISNVQTTVNGISTAVTSTIPTALSNIQSALSGISAAIASIGTTGPTVGTSNDATVSTSPSFGTVSAFTTGATSWVQAASGTPSDQVLSGYALSVDKGTVTLGVLYVSLTATPGGPGATYAIPIGTTSSGSSVSGNLRFPFHIPQGDSVYVQVTSASGKSASVTVQLQFENLPINP
jgi:hypothetical protein